MCRLNAEASLRSWLPPYAVLGAGRRPLKGHCRQPPRLGAERGAPRSLAPPEAALCGGSGSALRRGGGACAGGPAPLPGDGDFGRRRRGKSFAAGTELPLIGAEGVIFL